MVSAHGDVATARATRSASSTYREALDLPVFRELVNRKWLEMALER